MALMQRTEKNEYGNRESSELAEYLEELASDVKCASSLIASIIVVTESSSDEYSYRGNKRITIEIYIK